jgi:hypothetical protein
MKFAKGGPGGPGRGVGVKNRLTRKILEDLHAEWEEGGRAAMRIARIEDPVAFVKICTSLLPRELLVGNAVSEFDDAALEQLAEHLMREIEQEKNQPMKLIEAKAVERVERS